MEYNYNCCPSSTFNSSSSSSSTSRNMSSRKNGGGGGGSKKTSKGGSSSSTVRLSTDPQSVAARERRHRISDRFKILQSMVPGGTKMDTVSMLDEAIQYVKFLKAQIWLHQTMINFADDDPAAGLLPPPACFSSQYEQQTDQFGAVAYSNGMGGAAENLLPPLPPQPPLLPVPEYSCFQAEDIMSNYYDAYTTNYN